MRTTNALLRQRFWTLTAAGHSHCLEGNSNVANRQWIYTGSPLVPRSSPAGKLGVLDSSCTVERQELLWRQYPSDPTAWIDSRKDEKSSRFSDFRPPSSNVLPLQLHAGASTVPEFQKDGVAQAVIGLCETGQLSRAIDALTLLVDTQFRVPTSLLYRVIQRCGAEKNLVLGRRVHNLTVQLGYESDAFFGNHILRMYARQGLLQEAMEVFSRVAKPNVFMWASIISAQAKHGKPSEAIRLYREMRSSGLEPDGHVYVAALQACGKAGDVESGRKVHGDVLKSGIQPDSYVCSCLVDMYAKFGELEAARSVFDGMGVRNAVAWNSMINGYAEHGLGQEALSLYARMEQDGLNLANSVTFACLLKACASSGALQKGRQLHSQIVDKGLLSGNVILGNCLVNMYAKCGDLEGAAMVFDSMTSRDAVTWNAMISGYAEQGLGQKALTLYARMEHEGLTLADTVTYACLLKACAVAGALQRGKSLHSHLVERGLVEGNVTLGNCLVNMYARCGKLEDARMVFDSLATRDAVTWTTMINAYAEHGLGADALSLYPRMEQDGLILANSVTFVCLLKACASAGALQQGRELHSQIVGRGLLERNVGLGNSLVHMYAKCGDLEDARMVFDGMAVRNAVTWNTMISGYVERELGLEALNLYAKMEQDCLILADSVTFTCLLKACATVGALQKGKQLHSQIVDRGLLEGNVALGNCLINMYAKCGRLHDARMVFDSLARRDAVTWTAMINGYGLNNEGHKAIACFEDMILTGVQPVDTTFTCLFAACSHEGLVSKGLQYFDAMERQHGLNPTVEHYTCMVDLLGRAGHLDEAETMLSSIECENDTVGLTSLLHACKSHGDVKRGIRCFERLLKLDPQNAAAYVLMANTYADSDRWADVDRIERLRKSSGARKKPAVAGIEVNKQVQTFVVGEGRADISCKVQTTNVLLKDMSYVPHTEVVLKPLSEKDKENELCGHAEKLALAYGLLNTPEGTPLLVTKNLRMCRDCHSSTEMMSRVEKRDIVVRDAYCVHRFEAGYCSCKGRC